MMFDMVPDDDPLVVPPVHVPACSAADMANATMFRVAKEAMPMLGADYTALEANGDNAVLLPGPTGLLQRTIDEAMRAMVTQDWKVGEPLAPIAVQPSPIEEVLADAPPRARVRLLEALELADTGAASTKAFHRFKITVKRELWHVQGKAPRVYHAPTPSRTLHYAPFWHAFLHQLVGHPWSVKGLTPPARAQVFLDHAVRWGCRWGIGGDVSAWDTSWTPTTRLLVAQTVQRWMKGYDDMGMPPGAPRRLTGKFLEMLAYGLHQSGESDNGPTNGILHAGVRIAGLRLVYGVDPVTDPAVLMKVEGDDGADVFNGAECPLKAKRYQQWFAMLGFEGSQVPGVVDCLAAPHEPPLEFCSAMIGGGSKGALSLPVQPRAFLRSLYLARTSGDLAGLRVAKACSLAVSSPGTWVSAAVGAVLGKGAWHMAVRAKHLDDLDARHLTLQDLVSAKKAARLPQPDPLALAFEATQLQVTVPTLQEFYHHCVDGTREQGIAAIQAMRRRVRGLGGSAIKQ